MKKLEFPLLKIITPNKSQALKREHHQTEMTFSDTKMHWILRQIIHYILKDTNRSTFHFISTRKYNNIPNF